MKGLSMSTRFARSAHHPIRPATTAMPLAGRQRKLLLILALGLLASVVHPILAHAQGMVRVGYPPAQAVQQPAQPTDRKSVV